jgi:glyoxylase-like metal-dependent hydrolase (beta-lactamase superfamily II)
VEWVRHESRFWQMTSLTLRDGERVVLVDPGVAPDEVERIRLSAGSVEAVLLTHSDWDHVAGLAAFPDAEAAMGEETARVVRSGAAGAALERESRALALGVTGLLRVDRVLPTGPARVGAFDLTVLALPGHTACSTGYHVPALGLLVAGDYLSPVEHPYVEHSVSAYRESLETLLDLLRAHPGTVVAPGHGTELSSGAAIAVGEADLGYLVAVEDAVAEALADGADHEEAAAAGASVEPPRGADLAGADDARRRTAELALAEEAT